MLARVYRRLAAGSRPCLVSARAELEPALAALVPAPVVVDEYAQAGPLGGLVSAAVRVSTPLLFAAAGDLPDLDAAFVDDLEREYDRRAAAGEKPEAIVPAWPDGKLEPLAALYLTRAIADCGRRALAAGRRKVTAAFEGLRVVRFAVRPEDEGRLVNVNTPRDYDGYRE